ncbi:MAG: aryl-sulfate sulfotransferase [Rhodothermales bacterium]|nr:aryl-sulfate sulfotransferase [Rhodothermales bacterium]
MMRLALMLIVTAWATGQVRAQVEPHAIMGATNGAESTANDPIVINGVSIPSDFPFMDVTVSDDPAPGYIFLNNWGGQPYNMILDNAGAPVWYLRTPDRRRDFKLQPNGRLTMLIRGGFGGGIGHISLDSTFAVVDTIRAANGYETDEHELTMLADGGYLLIGRREETVDMSRFVVGGQPNAIVRETVIQEFSADGRLVFQWRSWDNYDIRDLEMENLQGNYIRFPHLNAIDIDYDGHILVSARHLSEVTKIHRQTGEIIWRLGGAHNEFQWINDPFNGFSSQHDIRALGNNRYTIFDNGNLHSPPETRAVEYEIDPVNMTATLVWQYRHSPPRYTGWMGNAQRLPNGNTLVNYADASLPKITEVHPDGSKALEMDFAVPANCYRAFKFDWMGEAAVPYLVAEGYTDRITLLFNKFGDSDVDHYNVYGGTTQGSTDLLATSFDPFVHLTELENSQTYFFRVTSVDGAGVESGFSNEESVFVNFTMPGANMVRNGDFAEGVSQWEFEVTGQAQASVSVPPGGPLSFLINQGGTEWWNVQLRQPGMPLVRGRQYVFEFDAHADSPRVFEAKVTKDGDPWNNYGRISRLVLSTEVTHYRFPFTMLEPSDPAARVVINVGTSDIDVHIANVMLREMVPGTGTDEEVTSTGTTIQPAYPTPVRGSVNIGYRLGQPAHVVVSVYDVLGRHVATVVNEWQQGGNHLHSLDTTALPAGVYFYRVDTRGPGAVNTSNGATLVVVN